MTLMLAVWPYGRAASIAVAGSHVPYGTVPHHSVIDDRSALAVLYSM